MASLDLNRIMDNLRVRLPGAVDSVLQLELFNTLNEFCCGSNIWREKIDVPITAGVKIYDLTPSGNSKVVRLMSLVDGNDFPVSAAIDTIDFTLELFDTPNTSSTFYATVALTVDDPVNTEGYPNFPSWILATYQVDIEDGVLARMMSQPAKPYSNTQLALFHQRRFTSATAVARAEAQRRYTYGGQVWRFPQSFNRRKAYR